MLVCVPRAPAQDAIRRVQRIQIVTILWMSIEAVVSLSAAWRANSPALVAFGGDSAVELLSAVVVLWRFGSHDAHGRAEKNASLVAGALLFVLGAFVGTTSVLTIMGSSEPKPSYLGIAVLAAEAGNRLSVVVEKQNF